MARAARMIGDGGVIGWLLPETTQFPSEATPTFAYIQIAYVISGSSQENCNLAFFTNGTQAEIRALAKDAIREDVIAKLGVTIPRAQIKMLNSPE